LSRLVRTGLLEADDAGGRLADFDAWRAVATLYLDIHTADVRVAHVFVRCFDLMLRAPDALNAAICRREDHVLVTLERRLAAAADEPGIADPAERPLTASGRITRDNGPSRDLL
jgi:hypothetical protein